VRMLLSNQKRVLRGFADLAKPFFVGARMTRTARKNRTVKEVEKAPRTCEECARWAEIKEKARVSKVLTKAIKGFEKRLLAEDYKPTVGDFLKLLQMEQELEQDAPKEIKVTWVEPLVTSDSER